MFKIDCYYENVYTGSIIRTEAIDNAYVYAYFFQNKTQGKIPTWAYKEWIEISEKRFHLLRDLDDEIQFKIYLLTETGL